jgi:hypothetical protein
MAKLRKIDIESLREAARKASSAAEAARELSLGDSGGNTTRLKKILLENKIDTSHWTGQLWSKGKTCLDDKRIRKTRDVAEIFVENSNTSSSYVRKLILKKSLKKYACEKCSLTGEWNGKSINLQLDHVNGNRKDHRLENLRWLCPNCHSQTDTFCSRNGNKQKASDGELRKALLESPNIRQALAKFDLENGGNYRRAKKIIRKIIEESG